MSAKKRLSYYYCTVTALWRKKQELFASQQDIVDESDIA